MPWAELLWIRQGSWISMSSIWSLTGFGACVVCHLGCLRSNGDWPSQLTEGVWVSWTRLETARSGMHFEQLPPGWISRCWAKRHYCPSWRGPVGRWWGYSSWTLKRWHFKLVFRHLLSSWCTSWSAAWLSCMSSHSDRILIWLTSSHLAPFCLRGISWMTLQTLYVSKVWLFVGEQAFWLLLQSIGCLD